MKIENIVCLYFLLYSLFMRFIWESESLISVKLVIFRAQNLGYLFWNVQKEPFIPCLLFISCLCSGLGSSVYCCKIYHPKLGSSELTNVSHDWKMCDTCVLMDTAYLLHESGISAGKLKAWTESTAQPWNQLEACFALLRGRLLVWAVGWDLGGVTGENPYIWPLCTCSGFLTARRWRSVRERSQGSGAFFYDLTVEVTWGHSCLSHKPPISRFRA